MGGGKFGFWGLVLVYGLAVAAALLFAFGMLLHSADRSASQESDPTVADH